MMKKRWKKRAGMFLGCLFAGILGVPALQAHAAGSDTIQITVGYWGDKEYTKATVSMDELAENCGTNQVIYTWIDNRPAAGKTEAEGVYLRDVMDYVGIDMNSVHSYNFYTRDAGNSQSSANHTDNSVKTGDENPLLPTVLVLFVADAAITLTFRRRRA